MSPTSLSVSYPRVTSSLVHSPLSPNFSKNDSNPDGIEVAQFGGQQSSTSSATQIQGNGPWQFDTIGADCEQNWLKGGVAEILFFRSKLGPNLTDEVERYLRDRYGFSQ